MIGDRGLCDLAERYGAAELADMMAGLLDHTERLLRNEIAGWPDGTVEFTDFMDSDGIDVQDVPLNVRLTIRGDELIADFTQSAPMVRGALNCTPSFVEATVYHTVMAASATHIPPTGGATRPITVVTKPGTACRDAGGIVDARRYGLPLVRRHERGTRATRPTPRSGRRRRENALAFFAGQVADEPFLYSEIVVGTWGGRPIADGNDGLANPCAGIANISIEVAESNWPILIERYGLVPDSGGAGRFRGGLAVARVWRATVPDTLLQVRSDRQVHRPYGLNGGLPGTPSANRLLRVDGSEERLPPMFGAVLQRGDVYDHRMPGGGGWGDPLDRDPQAVAWDVRNEKVSSEAARADYGVVLTSDGGVDDQATEALRRSRRS